MKRQFVVILIIFLILGLAVSEQVKQKFGVGVGAGMQRTLNGDVFLTTGTAYSGNLKFGLTNDLDIYWFKDYYSDTAYIPSGGEWKSFKANQLTAMLSLGFEVFPISNVGIDVGIRFFLNMVV